MVESLRSLTPGDLVGFVGLGNMGQPMAARVLGAGFRIVGFDPSPDAGSSLADLDGFSRAETIADVAGGTRAVVLMLPNSTVVDQVLLGDGLLDAIEGAESAAEGRAYVIDMSSSQPEETQRLRAEAERRGVRLIDAPVSGGVPAARDGSLTIMVGGPKEEDEACRPLLEPIGSHIVHAGPIGAGHALKALNNLLSASTLVASSEALLVGTKFGLDPEVMMDAINGSSGRSWSTLTKWPRYIIPRNFDSGFLLGLLLKDTRIAVALAESTGVPAAHARATLELWQAASEDLPPDADHTDIHRWIEQRCERGEKPDTAKA